MNKRLCNTCKCEIVCGTMRNPGKNTEYGEVGIVKCDDYKVIGLTPIEYIDVMYPFTKSYHLIMQMPQNILLPKLLNKQKL